MCIYIYIYRVGKGQGSGLKHFKARNLSFYQVQHSKHIIWGPKVYQRVGSYCETGGVGTSFAICYSLDCPFRCILHPNVARP